MTLLQDDRSAVIRLWHATSSSSQPGPVEVCCERWLDGSERQRASRFRQPKSRNQHVIGKGMARRLLGDDRIDPLMIQFGAEQFGKPYVAAPDKARRPFNVAHTDGLVMCESAMKPTDWSESMSSDSIGRPTPHWPIAISRNRKSSTCVPFAMSPRGGLLSCASGRSRNRSLRRLARGFRHRWLIFAFEQIESESPVIRMLSPKLSSENGWTFFSLQPRPGFIGAVAVSPRRAHQSVELEVCSFDEIVSQ